MAPDADDDGFLSRWSRRKVSLRQGVGVPDAVSPPLAAPPPVHEAAAPSTPAIEPSEPLPPAPAAPAQPALTLADAAALTRDSDYTRFMAGNVQPDVKNAALAKLFTDPHFNVMDGLDVYIDDYGKPDPLPPGMLRQMLQARVLGLFDDDDDEETKIKNATDPAPALPADAAAQPPLVPATDEDTDLQLQPDDGARRPGADAGTGEDARQPH